MSVGMSVGISAAAEGLRFKLKIGEDEIAGNFVTAPAEDRELTVALEQEAGGESKAASEGSTYKLVVSAGSDKEEHSGLSLRSNLATKVNASSKLIKLEETAGAPDEAALPAATDKSVEA